MRKNLLKSLLTVLFAIFLLLLSQTAASIFVVLLHSDSLLRPGMTFEELDQFLLDVLMKRQTEILLISYAIVVAALLLVAAVKKRRFLDYTGLRRPAGISLIVPAVLTGMTASLWTNIAVGLFPWPQSWIDGYMEAASVLETVFPALDLLAVCLLGPVVEEILFRGLIYDAFCQVLPAGLAVVFQAVLFGSVHGSNIWMIYTGLMGLLLGYVRKHTGSLWPTIALHIAYNSASYLWEPLLKVTGENDAAVAGLFLGSAILMLAALSAIRRRTVPPQPPKTEE